MKFLFPLFLLSACSSPSQQLSEKAQDLEVYGQKPKTCRVMGRVQGIDKNGSRELATNHALNQAAELGASGIFINQEVPNGAVMNIHATAYQCE